MAGHKPSERMTHPGGDSPKMFLPQVASSLIHASVLLAREQRFASTILGRGVPNPCCRNFTSTPALFPRLCLLERLYRIADSPTTISSKKSECSKVGKRLFGVLCLMSRSSSLVKLIRKKLLKMGQTNKTVVYFKEFVYVQGNPGSNHDIHFVCLFVFQNEFNLLTRTRTRTH